jgi:hypothetical protein
MDKRALQSPSKVAGIIKPLVPVARDLFACAGKILPKSSQKATAKQSTERPFSRQKSPIDKQAERYRNMLQSKRYRLAVKKRPSPAKIACPDSKDNDTQGALFTFVLQLLDRVQVQCQHYVAAFDASCKVGRDRHEVCMSILGMNSIEGKELLSVANGGGFDVASVPWPEGLESLATLKKEESTSVVARLLCPDMYNIIRAETACPWLEANAIPQPLDTSGRLLLAGMGRLWSDQS